MSFRTKSKSTKAAHKTKQDALAAARKAFGKEAMEGVDFQLRNTGAGWAYEVAEPEQPPAKKSRAKRAPNPEVTAEHKRQAERGPDNKTDTVVKMLKSKFGATSKQMEEATGWKAPSVRGLLGTLKQRGVQIMATKVKGSPTVYRIVDEAPAEVI